MFGRLLKTTLGLATDTAKIVVAPVAAAVEITRQATKPIADVAEETVKAVTPPQDDK